VPPPLAVKVVFGTVHDKAKPLLFVIATVGTVLSKVVVALAVAVQPFGLVTVTVNVPAVVIAPELATAEPLLHKYVPPPLAVNVVLGIVQLKAKPLLFVIATVGIVLSKVVVALAVAVQPFGLVTVTVNVPAVVIAPELATAEPLLHK
jgi:NADH:ubiquinone oxidoreductase subunit K